MRPIPPKLKKELSDDPFMATCIWTGEKKDVSWEHCWIYAGRQINEKWAIVPLRRDLNCNISGEVKEYCRYISMTRATDEDLKKYPKKDWYQIKKYLFNKYKNERKRLPNIIR